MIEAETFYQEIRTGSSLPLLVGGSDGKRYVVKLGGGGDGVLAHAVDWLSTRLAQWLEIPVLEPVLMRVPSGFAQEDWDPEIRELVEKSVGVHLATEYREDARTYGDEDEGAVEKSLKGLVFLYDLFLLNVDRGSANPNMILSGDQLWCLDFSSSMAMHRVLGRELKQELPFLRQLQKHPFRSRKVDKYNFVRKVKAIGDEKLAEAVGELPEEWVSQLFPGEDVAAARGRVLERLIGTREQVNVVVRRLDVLRVLKVETEEERREQVLRNKEALERLVGKI